jgi:hypothetical protein
MQTLSMKPRLYFIVKKEQAGSSPTESNGAMYVLEHLKELDRSTGRRYGLAGQCTSVSVARCSAAGCIYFRPILCSIRDNFAL